MSSELNENQMSAAFAKKVARVISTITGIEKNGRNEHFKYDFVSDPDVLRSVREAILDAGLVILPSINESRREGSNTHIRGTFEIIDTETGYIRTYCWEGESDDKQDKGISKAATSFVKYFLLKAFLIPTGDDPDANGPAESARPKASKKEPVPAKQRAGRADPSCPFGWLMTDLLPGEWQHSNVSDKQFKFYQEQCALHGIAPENMAPFRSFVCRAYGLDPEIINKAGGFSFGIEFLKDANDNSILRAIEEMQKALNAKKPKEAA